MLRRRLKVRAVSSHSPIRTYFQLMGSALIYSLLAYGINAIQMAPAWSSFNRGSWQTEF
ncbi:MAG: hypothetical protein OXH65_10105 [Paracoccaceae bacterium]|nr:hypothetical protein [Paracoccaceae bacterium]